MQSTPDGFEQASEKDIRQISYAVWISFSKQYDTPINFFTIEESLIGGSDILPSPESDVIQEADKYKYNDYSGRVIGIEWEHEVDPFSSVTMGMADIILDNHDDYFTPNSGSEIDGFILPFRPIRIYAGFEGKLIPIFTGITERVPKINERDRTASFHCIDFMYSLMNRPLIESEIYLDKRVDELISNVFVLAGLEALQLDLDISATTVPFVAFKKDDKVGDIMNKLCEAGQGRLYMNSVGTIKYKNRTNYNASTVKSFNAYDHIVEAEVSEEDQIVNVVEINGEKREVQPLQRYWEMTLAEEIPAGSSIDLWAEFIDPVTSIEAPSNYAGTYTNSYFIANTSELGDGTNSTDVVLSSSSAFGESYKMTFTNNGASTLYITEIVLFATPATVVNKIYVREEDATSVGAYGERILSINNDFFQSEDDAQRHAENIIDDYKNYGEILEIEVKGTPSLEIEDYVHVNLFDRIGDYVIIKQVNKIEFSKYTQILTVKPFTIPQFNYFTINLSTIGGTDQLAP